MHNFSHLHRPLLKNTLALKHICRVRLFLVPTSLHVNKDLKLKTLKFLCETLETFSSLQIRSDFNKHKLGILRNLGKKPNKVRGWQPSRFRLNSVRNLIWQRVRNVRFWSESMLMIFANSAAAKIKIGGQVFCFCALSEWDGRMFTFSLVNLGVGLCTDSNFALSQKC